MQNVVLTLLPLLACVIGDGKECKICRQALRRKWLDVVGAAVKQAKAKARQLEEVYWTKYRAAVTVTISGKVIDAKGKPFMPTRLEAKAF